MNYDPFVLPFMIGMAILLAVLATRYAHWISRIEPSERHNIYRVFFGRKLVAVLQEILLETLLHRKIFKKNVLLGYMHASIACGWFLLIVAGSIESRMYSRQAGKEIWDPVFFKYFHHDLDGLPLVEGFQFVMDFLLLIVLSGILFAWVKRVYSRMVGMQKTTRHILIDRIGLTAIWFIFPLRLLAESITAGRYHNGGFLTQHLGDLLSSFLPLQHLEYGAWWAYSISLGAFFVALPFTRYMHIPTEVMLVAIRASGIRTRKEYTGYSEFEVHSCSRCGICIDVCQLRQVVNRGNMVPAYYLQGIRQARDDLNGAFDCLMCGRCQEACPVGIGIGAIRQVRRSMIIGFNGGNYAYLDHRATSLSGALKGSSFRSAIPDRLDPPAPPETDVVYFAGCMTHLTPGVKRAMIRLLDKAKVNYWFMDRDRSLCCGRPLQLAGKNADALLLKEHNRSVLLGSGASVLVTSCPICLRIFREEYELDMIVLHHTEYFAKLVKEGRLKPRYQSQTAVYHDPCELGRGLREVDSSRALLSRVVSLQVPKQEREEALCCGGSIAELAIRPAERVKIASAAAAELCAGHPDHLITSCPLCKKTFAAVSPVKVRDIAELLEEACVGADRGEP